KMDTGPETSGSAFVLQCEQLLEETRVDKEKRKRVIGLANQIVEALNAAKPKGHKGNYKKRVWLKKLGISFPLLLSDEQIEKQLTTVEDYSWIKPEKIEIMDDSTIRVEDVNEVFVRLIVTMDKKLLDTRDFLNGIYHTKRALVLCSAAAIIKGEVKSVDLSFVCERGDSLLPILRVRNGDLSVDISITSGPGWIKPVRFTPAIGNVRPSWAHGEKAQSKDCSPSPHLNQSLAFSIHESSLLLSIQSRLIHKPKLQDAITLLQKWARTRRLRGLTPLFIRGWMIHLLNEGKVNEKKDMMTSVVSCLQSLANLVCGTVVCVDGEKEGLTASTISPISLWDESGSVNMGGDITQRELLRIHVESTRTLSSLGDLSAASSLFLDELPFVGIFDHYMQLTLTPTVLSNIDLVTDTVSERDKLNLFIRHLSSQIETGMGERVEYWDVAVVDDFQKNLLESSHDEWNVSSDRPKEKKEYRIILGFNPSQQWNSPLTMGPMANSPDVAAFSSFWKGQAHVRKFADSRICMTMAWGETPSEAVPLKIIGFILSEYWSMDPSSLSWRTSIDSELRGKRSNQERTAKAFSKLSEMLRGVKGLPLSVTNVHAVSPYLRGTEPDDCVFAETRGGALKGSSLIPIDNRLPVYKPSVYVQIKLEHSGKWGEEDGAMEALTTAFYLKLAEGLKQLSVMAVATKRDCRVNIDEVVFRVEVMNGKEHAMLRKRVETLKNAGASRGNIQPAQHILEMFETKFVREQQLSSSLGGLATPYPAYADCVLMMKRWIGTNHLSPFINDYTIELLVASQFTEKTKKSIPKSGWNAFTRVLTLITTHNWALKPLIVDFMSEWNDEKRARMESSFLSLRPVLPPMVIVCNEDEKGCVWTRENPDPVILRRLISLASLTLSLLVENVHCEKPIDVTRVLSRESWQAYDVVLDLVAPLVSRLCESRGRSWKGSMAVIDWDPVEAFLHELNAHFGHLAYFFFNRYRPVSIGVKFKPHEDGLAVSLTRCGGHKRDANGRLVVNRNEVMEGIKIMAGPLLAKIYIPGLKEKNEKMEN
ncbi:hypothetical protein PENTCL1PPCAC_6839, partial [Pristionchus entomophagus]